MKVHELIAKLNELDKDLDVYCLVDIDFTKDKDTTPMVFDVLGASPAPVTTSRDASRRPILTFGGGPGSRLMAFIDITPDF